MLHFPLVLVNRLNKTESAVFLYCRISLFLKDPFFQITCRKTMAGARGDHNILWTAELNKGRTFGDHY